MKELNNLSSLINDFEKSEKGRVLLKKFYATIKDFGMADYINSGVAVGFSGGSDSVFLLLCLWVLRKKEKFPLAAIHVNHRIRGEEAVRDEDFSREFAKSLGLEFYCFDFDVLEISKESKRGVEEVARECRYSAFSEFLKNNRQYRCIATAHNSTDNVETVLFNLMRGTGSAGMKGIAPIRDYIIRPLINISKEDINNALENSGIPFVFDSSNASLEYTRNFIRNEILPKFRKIFDNPEGSVLRLCSNLREDNEFIESISNDFIAKNIIEGKIPCEELKLLHPAVISRVLKKLAGNSIEAVHINSIKKLLIGGGNFRIDIPEGKSFVSEDGKCYIRARQSENKFEIKKINYKLSLGINIIEELSVAVLISYDENEVFSSNVYKFSIQQRLSSDIIIDDISIRTKEDGDAYRFGGMTRRVKKLFSDKKIPLKERSKIPVFSDKKGIFWIPGFPLRDDLKDKNGGVFISLYKLSPA